MQHFTTARVTSQFNVCFYAFKSSRDSFNLTLKLDMINMMKMHISLLEIIAVTATASSSSKTGYVCTIKSKEDAPYMVDS